MWQSPWTCGAVSGYFKYSKPKPGHKVHQGFMILSANFCSIITWNLYFILGDRIIWLHILFKILTFFGDSNIVSYLFTHFLIKVTSERISFLKCLCLGYKSLMTRFLNIEVSHTQLLINNTHRPNSKWIIPVLWREVLCRKISLLE